MGYRRAGPSSRRVRGLRGCRVFDRGCFHTFDEHRDRARCAERVAGLLAQNGRWLSLIGSTEGGERDWGPPRRTARDVIIAIEPDAEAASIRESVEYV